MIDRYRVLFRLAVLSWAPWVAGWLTGFLVAIAAAAAGVSSWRAGLLGLAASLATVIASAIAIRRRVRATGGCALCGSTDHGTYGHAVAVGHYRPDELVGDVYVECRLCKGAKEIEMHRITRAFQQGPLETMVCPYCHGEGRLYDVLANSGRD